MKEIKIEVPEGYEIDKENSTFETIKFKEKSKLPMSWKEVMNLKGYYINSSSLISEYNSSFGTDGDKNTWPTKELAEAALALSQLLQLRDRWNGDWKADWCSDDYKYSIGINQYNISKYISVGDQYILVFNSGELRDKFLYTFKDLIEIAKPLL